MERVAADAREPTVAVEVLGPLRLTVGGVEVDVPGPKRRAVLALLAMASPRTISADSLVDALWPDAPPRSGRAALHSHLSRLRGHLGAAAPRLVATGGGYRLQLEPEELDARRADALVQEARAEAARAPDVARERLEHVRALWRGRALAEFADTAPLSGWSRSLEELRLAATDLLADCALASGDTSHAAALAAETMAAEPLREASVLRLMRALASGGRSAEALRVGHDYRRQLAEDAGLQPTAALGELEHMIANGQLAPADAPVVAAPARRLPVPATELIGRNAELAGVSRLLESARFVTLVGPGGVGKTRLALEAAGRARAARDVVFVSLAPVTDASAIIDVLAGELALREPTGDPGVACAAALAPGRRLLVLDNCEHALNGVQELAAMLIGACPGLTILATSRERIGLTFEQTCYLAPLPVPPPEQIEGVEAVPSAAVFLERARRVRPDLDVGPQQLAVIGEIVRRLEGVPLAIELAAARLSALTLDDLNRRLDHVLDLLGGGVGVDERHRTLRTAIKWSYDLLPGDEQQLFRNLAVFPDGFDLATAEHVARDLDSIVEPVAAVAHLVDASMLLASLDDTPRYRMLDTLRAFGIDQLIAVREHETATARLLRWATDLARWIEDTMQTGAEPLADARLRTELGNIREAWRVARTTGKLDLAATIAISLHEAASWRDLTEVGRWAVELAHDNAMVNRPTAALVHAIASEAVWMNTGSLDEAERLARRGLELTGSDDRRGRLRCLASQAFVDHFRGRYDTARALQLEATALAEWRVQGFAMAALAAAYANELDVARQLNHRAADAATSPTEVGFTHYVAAEISNTARDSARAASQYRDALTLARAAGATFLEGVASVGLVSGQGARGQVHEALRGYDDLITYWEQTGGWTQQWTTLRNLGDLLDTLGDHDTATFLRRAADAAPEASTRPDTTGTDALEAAREQVLDRARQAISGWLATTSAIGEPLPQ